MTTLWCIVVLIMLMASVILIVATDWLNDRIEKLKSWHRRWTVDRRIKKQAKAAGVWGNIKALGGRALSIYAWEHYRIVRNPGETDKELRRRCMYRAGDAKEEE